MIIQVIGLAIFMWRLQPWLKSKLNKSNLQTHQLVSIIVPCRNEEQNIGTLLLSLQKLTSVQTEIIVVDDSSTDRTFEIASCFAGVKVISAGEKPEGWSGKCWACLQGAKIAQGDFLLFTDADTEHFSGSLSRMMQFCEIEKANLVSAPPFHKANRWYEKILGLFHLLPLIATSYRATPKANRLFAIGQYLLVKKSSYFECGTHQAIHNKLADDVEMAKLFIRNQKKFSVYPSAEIFSVQMYSDLKSFLKGWLRLLRLGVRYSSVLGLIEVFFVILLFASVESGSLSIAFWVFGIICLAWSQEQHGRFPLWSAIFAPLSVLLFITLSVIGVCQRLLRTKVKWHERNYADT